MFKKALPPLSITVRMHNQRYAEALFSLQQYIKYQPYMTQQPRLLQERQMYLIPILPTDIPVQSGWCMGADR